MERALVELVDLALDGLCQQEIADQDLVDERRHEVAGPQLPQSRLAVEAVVETFEGRNRPAVNGEDDVGSRDEVDLAAHQAWRIAFVDLHRLERDVEAVSGAREASPASVRAQPVHVDIAETERLDSLVDRRLLVEAVDVDP